MFGITNYPGFILAVLVFLAIPGPGLLAILAATGKNGMRAGFASTLGTMVGDWLHMLLAGIGVAALLQANPAIFKAIQYAGAAYLMFIGTGLLGARQVGSSSVSESVNPGEHYFRRSFLITLLNPKAIVFYMAFFPLFIDPARHHGALTLLVMAATVSLITILFCFSCVAAVHAMAGKLKRNPRISKMAHRAAGLFLIGFGIKLTIN
ncbi:LysE family transporter [Herminiimonas sp. CN]|uniref:LysE family transporter n=1 Tax=Herminiimonas sp. CN TaxID=1349818 RepID=UPI000473E142|nr:LysE family transporter [Herminiimonas sp. CN]